MATSISLSLQALPIFSHLGEREQPGWEGTAWWEGAAWVGGSSLGGRDSLVRGSSLEEKEQLGEV